MWEYGGDCYLQSEIMSVYHNREIGNKFAQGCLSWMNIDCYKHQDTILFHKVWELPLEATCSFQDPESPSIPCCLQFNDLLILFLIIPWRRKQQPTLAFLPRKSHGQRSLVGYSLGGPQETQLSDSITTINTQEGKVQIINISDVYFGEQSSWL